MLTCCFSSLQSVCLTEGECPCITTYRSQLFTLSHSILADRNQHAQRPLMVCALSFWWANGLGGSTECPLQPAAHARSAATAAGLSTQAPPLLAPEDHKVAPASDQQLGPSDTASAAEPTAGTRPQAARGAKPLGDARRHDPCPLQAGGPFQTCWGLDRR